MPRRRSLMGVKQHLIDWDATFPVLNKYSLLKVFIGIVTMADDDLKWYSNEESRAKIQWRFQISPSTVKIAISKLKDCGVITSTVRGIYKLDKKYLINYG